MFEVKFSFLLIIEYSESIIVYKNNVSGLKTLNEFIEPLDYSLISRLYIKDGTKYEKFYVSNMSTADNAIRNKSLEVNNLQGTISRIGAPKQVIHNMRVSNEQIRTSLSLNTSRINNLRNRDDLQSFLQWSVEVARKINAFNWKDTYLDNFAQPISFEDNKENLEPICILIKFDKLLDEIERENIESIYKIDENEERIEGFDINEFIDHFNTTLKVSQEEDSNSFTVENEIDAEMKLNFANKSLRLNSKEFKSIKIDKGNDDVIDLNSFINFRNDFIVNFNEPNLIYTYRKLFKDHRLLADIEGFLSIFIPHDGLITTTSEKGNFSDTQTIFETNFVFRFVQDELASDSISLFCDDLGNEWADFIAIKKDAIVFYHAKHKTGSGLSASALQDIIGQAHKNLGNLEPTDKILDKKASDKWGLTYNADTFRTNIKRLIIAPNDSIDEAISSYKTLLSQPNADRQVNLVVDFISKQELRDGLELLSKNQTFERRNEVTQILWFVSSLTANCRELGIDAYITCRP